MEKECCGVRGKKAMELALNTMILLTLGLIVLIGLVVMFTMGVSNFTEKISLVFTSSNVDSFVNNCNLQVSNGQSYEYCCVNKTAKFSSKDKLQISCGLASNMSWAGKMEKINCDGVC